MSNYFQPTIVLTRTILNRDFRLFEWMSTIAMLGLALTLVVSPHSMEKSAFTWMLNDAMTQLEMMSILLIAGLMRVVALYINGSSKKIGPNCRVISAVIGIAMWGQMALALIEYRPELDAISPSVSVYIALVIGEILSCFRAACDVRHR